MTTTWDCIVVGAGAAGLSGALVLGRARRRTLVIDAGEQSNRPAEGMGGLLGQDGRAPDDFYATARAEVDAYPSVELRRGTVVGGEAGGGSPGGGEAGFVLELADGSREAARTVLLATGMDYSPPELPGVAERWGGSVFHCPFCHGWEHRDEPLGVLGGGPNGVRLALMLRLWTDDVTLLTNGPAGLEAEDAERLAAAAVRIDERRVTAVEGPGDGLEAVVLADGERLPLRGLLVPAPMSQRSGLAEQLGATLAEPTQVATDPVEVDAAFRTAVPGLFAAGDTTGHMASVARAIAAGHSAAAMIVHELAAAAHGVTPTGRA